MSDPFGGSPPLTPEQQAVVDLPFDARALVTAGAGAGKTHTLVRRLDALIDREKLTAGELLVLSFSRAAVRELKERLVRHGESARHVRVQTFDSWALDLLVQADAQGEWQARPFDERIKAATDLIAGAAADDLFEDLQHVIIDEVQDLVGDRREMVETLLDSFRGLGFTVVGDAAQAIYCWQVTDLEERVGESGRFFDWLRFSFGDELTELSLTKNFRAVTAEAQAALRFGPRLQKGENGQGLHRELRNVLLDCLHLGRLDDELVRMSLRDQRGTTAILCRTNGQALLVSGYLHEGRVPHRVQRSAQDRAVPAWIGLLYRTAQGSVMTWAQFDRLVPDLMIPQDTNVERVWDQLVRIGRSKGNIIDLARLRSIIAEGRLPDELTAPGPAGLVVSSIHRAKGLEFDRVLVVEPGPLREDAEDPAEEARMLYVALTRPRSELIRLELELPKPLYVKKPKNTGRWGRYSFARGQQNRRYGVEIGSNDVSWEAPAGGTQAKDVQDYLRSHVRSGDDVTLERCDDVFEELTGQSPRYRVLHQNHEIGAVSERFRKELYRYMQYGCRSVPNRWPRFIREVQVDTVETVAGNAAVGMRAGLGDHGVWLAPRLVGLSRFSFQENDESREDIGE